MINQGADVPALFPPEVVMEVKALACELPRKGGIPLSRFSQRDIAREVIKEGIVASISGITVWRWLSSDAIRPWSYRSWISPRDPNFSRKAGRVLDLYDCTWRGKPLGLADYVVCADEKTSIQARKRLTVSTPPGPKRKRRLEFDYERRGALAYLAAWDVHRARVFGKCEGSTGIDSFHKLVDLVMQKEPYCSANRVFWIVDNGSSHRGQASIDRMKQWYSNAFLVHTPIHASWLNQIEIYFSVVQRKVLTPNEFDDLEELKNFLVDFENYYQDIAKPFQWKFTRSDLKRLLAKTNVDKIEKRKQAA